MDHTPRRKVTDHLNADVDGPSVDELEDRIRAERGLAPLVRTQQHTQSA